MTAATASEPRVFEIAQVPSTSTWWFTAIFGALGLFGALVPLALVWPREVLLDVAPSGLQIGGSLYGRTIPRAALGAPRKLDVDAEPGYRAVSRTNGVGLPNFQGGWFRLANQQKALLFMTDWSHAVEVPTTEGYTLLVSPGDTDGFLMALARPAAETPAGASEVTRFPLAPSKASVGWLIPVAILLSLLSLIPLGLVASLPWATRKVRFEVSPVGMRVRGWYGRLIPREAICAKESEIIDMKSDPAFRWMIRTNGIGLPSYLGGWFRYKGGKSGLLFVSDRTRVLSIPTTLGYTVFVSPEDPEGLLKALRAA